MKLQYNFPVMIRKVFIANRGEIAVRVIRTCKDMGISTVAIYSEADRTAPHVLKADEAYCVGPSPSQDSYLNTVNIFEALHKSGADAIHPGYGFLSENADFAKDVQKKGIIWIGPSSKVITTMGDKMAARNLAIKAGVPVVPGTKEPVNDLSEAKKTAASMGYPVLIKAAGGGGGKGMKVANKPEELEKLLPLAKLEAKKYFNNDNVYIEKYFTNPRHIEVQILSGKNRTVHLNERDCSVQRKHQKLIEETPSPIIDKKIRSDLLEKTVKMVEKIGYEGAGTVEYIYEKGKFYFLEMNTRVQVEHPVTEVTTGIDIIKQQIAIASTGNTDLTQDDVKSRGHAIECRINAEDPSKNFQPSPGIISVCHQPSGFRTRVDGAIFQGCKITPYYDSLICKLICHGRNRTEAIQRMLRALDEFVIEGITTTINLHKKILSHEKFISSDFDVNWLVKEKFY